MADRLVPAATGSPAPVDDGAAGLTYTEQDEIRRGTARLASVAALRQILGTGILALTAAVVARALGAADFGVYAGGIAAYNLALAFTDFGFGVVATREMAKHPGQEDRLLGTIMQVQVMWSTLVAAGLLVTGLLSAGTRGGVMMVLCPAVLISGLTAARQIFVVRYRAAPLLVVDIGTAVLQGTAMIGLALLGAGILAVAAALSISVIVNVLLVVALARHMISPGKPRAADRVAILRMAIPVGVASLLASLYFTIDQVLLGWLVSSRQLGEYAAAVRLLSLLVTIPGFVMAAGIPGLARSATDRATLSRFAGRLAHWLAVTALPLSIGLMVFARPVVEVVFGHAYAESASLVRILMTAGVLALVSNVLGNVLLSLHVVRTMLIFNVLSLSVNVAGNLLLVPRYGVTASAWLTTACELIVVSYGVVALRHRLSYRIVLAAVVRPLIATVLGATVALALGPSKPYAAPSAIGTFLLAVLALRAWPSELLPTRLRYASTPSQNHKPEP
jgi:O-antigen/teichoic acid export membrane protein